MLKVLIAIDYEPTAQQVAETGYRFGKAMNARIILLHVIADSVYYSTLQYAPIMGFNGFLDTSMLPLVDSHELKKAAEDYLQRSKSHLGDEAIQLVTEEGTTTAASILKVANDMQADVIVMGSHSRSGLEKILMGSVTENVLHHSTIPLFIIPTKQKND